MCCVLKKEGEPGMAGVGRGSKDKEGEASNSWHWEEGAGLIREGCFLGRQIFK